MSMVDWKSLLPNADPSLNDIDEAKALAREMESWAMESYGDDPAPAPKPKAEPAPRDLGQEVLDQKFEVENLKVSLGEIIGQRGPESESARRMTEKLQEAKIREWKLAEEASSNVMHTALYQDSVSRARRDVTKEIEDEKKTWLASINQTAQRGSELHAWMMERFDEKKVPPEEVERRVQERAQQRVTRITASSEGMKDVPLVFRGDAPRLREVDAPINTAQQGYAKYLRDHGRPDEAKAVEEGRSNR
jgi:hypothetical protein